jgi:hypothetical protein
MKPLKVFALATLFILGHGASLFAQQPKLHRSLSHRQPPQSQKASPPKNVVDAIIRDIDHEQGLLTLDSEIGIMQVRLTPQEARNFHVGEKLQVW